MLPEDLQNEERLVHPSEFMELLGVKRSKFYNMLRESTLPKPINMGARMKVWPLSQVRQVISDIKQGQLSL